MFRGKWHSDCHVGKGSIRSALIEWKPVNNVNDRMAYVFQGKIMQYFGRHCISSNFMRR